MASKESDILVIMLISEYKTFINLISVQLRINHLKSSFMPPKSVMDMINIRRNNSIFKKNAELISRML
jgi:hypothetical protein